MSLDKIPPELSRAAARNPGNNGRKWEPIAMAVAMGMSNKAISDQFGVPGTTLQRWRANPKFREFVNRVHDNAVDEAVGKLAGVMASAADKIIALLDNESPKIQLDAIDRVERWFKIFRNDKLIFEKLQALEGRLPHVSLSNTIDTSRSG